MKEQYLAQRGEHEIHLNKTGQNILKTICRSCSSWLSSGLVSAKIPLPEMCRSHWVNLCGQDGDIWELLDYRFGSWERNK